MYKVAFPPLGGIESSWKGRGREDGRGEGEGKREERGWIERRREREVKERE